MAEQSKTEETPKIDKEFSDYYIKKMTMYCDNAKTYIQIAIGSLVVPITFYKEFLGKKDSTSIALDGWLITSWIFLLLSIGAGLMYQYFATKRIETRIEKTPARFFDNNPGYVYFLMATTFYLGVIFFIFSAYHRLSGVNFT